MTRAPTLSSTSDQSVQRLDAAIDQLIRLLARQAAGELGAPAASEENGHDKDRGSVD